jgi:DNA invertase Pin-like site-specific DNA recombinase
MGRAMFTIIGAMAELESSLISERVTAGMRAAEAFRRWRDRFTRTIISNLNRLSPFWPVARRRRPTMQEEIITPALGTVRVRICSRLPSQSTTKLMTGVLGREVGLSRSALAD